jgi:GNAT superfamily N-acetyltransferase
MIHCRLFAEGDRERVIELARQQAAELVPWLTFDLARINATLDRAVLSGPNFTLFVAEDADGVIGYLGAALVPYAAFSGIYAEQQLFFVTPRKRGSRAAAKLFAGFVRWAEFHRAEEIFAGIGWGDRTVAAARWMRRFGFEPAGQQIMRRRVGSS